MRNLRVALLAALLFIAGSVSAFAASITQVIVFGDSNVDNGNLRALLGPSINPPPNFGGRNNNGPVVVEYLAALLGVPLRDFAYSGATTGAPGLSPVIPNTLTQIQTYFGSLGGAPADPNALYVYWAGSNDILLATTPPGALPGKINGATANIDTALRQLDAAGATNIVVANRTPRPDLASTDNLNGIALNAAISALVQADDALLAARIQLFDAYGSIADMVNNPARYGFTQPTALCIDNPLGDGCPTDLAVAARYVNWDAAHKTTQVHTILAQQIFQQVPEPQQLALLAVALMPLGWLRRRAPTITDVWRGTSLRRG